MMKYCTRCQKPYPVSQRFCYEDGSQLSFQDPYHLVGHTIANTYYVEALVGIGGPSVVYRARQLVLDRPVALKILSPGIEGGDERTIALFERETETLAQLAHENIAAILDAGRTADHLVYMAVEWLEGVTLEDELAAQGGLDFNRVSEILRQVSAALDAAHDANIVHYDLKPSNIMLLRRPDGREQVKLLDFGIAKAIDESVPSPVSAVSGTPYYAREQLGAGSPIDRRADLYSLGITLYEMLTGRLSLRNDSISEGTPWPEDEWRPPLRNLRPETPPGVQVLINRLLATDPNERPQRAGEIPVLFQRAIDRDDRLPARGDQETSIFDSYDAAMEGSFMVDGSWDVSDPFSTRKLPAPAFVEQSELAEAALAEAALAEAALAEVVPDRQAPEFGSIARGLRLSSWKRVIALAMAGLILMGATFYRSFWAGECIDSLIVLPFKNVSADPNVEYLSAGLTESLITNLSQLSRLKVMASGSAFRYKDRDPQTVGRELNIQVVVAGQVEQRSDDLTINVELIDARDGNRLWSRLYRRKPADLLTVQEEITREISVKLRPWQTGEEQKRILKRPAYNAEVYNLYLNGRYYSNLRTLEGLKKGMAYFQQVTAKDPLNAWAFSGLANSYLALGPVGIGALSAAETMPKQKDAAVRALELNDLLAEAHTSLAIVKLVYDWDWAGAEQSYSRALELNANYAAAHHWYAICMTARGRFDEAITAARRALEIDPFSAEFSNALAGHYYYAGRYERARAQYLKTIEANPKFAQAHIDLSRVYIRLGQYDKALLELNDAVALSKRTPELIAALGYLHARSGKRAEALSLLTELRRLAKRERASPADLALVYLGLNDKEQALACLQRCYDDRSLLLLNIKVDPIYEQLRSDQRFADLLRRVGS